MESLGGASPAAAGIAQISKHATIFDWCIEVVADSLYLIVDFSPKQWYFGPSGTNADVWHGIVQTRKPRGAETLIENSLAPL